MNKMEREEIAADLVAQLENILVEHPQMVETETRINGMVLHGRRNPHREKQCMALIAPPGCGKTTILRNTVRKMNTPDALAEGRIPALYTTLKPTVGKKSLTQDILYELQRVTGRATHPEQGNENALLERTLAYLRLVRCELLVVDEFHHVVLSETEKAKQIVGEKIKWLLNDGPCPIVVSGTEKAEEPFRANAQLLRRAVPSIKLRALLKSHKADREWFGRFFGQFLKSMENSNVANNATSFVFGDTLAYLLDASDGVVGNGCKILAYAVREMALAGRRELLKEDFSNACELLLIGTSIKSNPFKTGLGGMRTAA